MLLPVIAHKSKPIDKTQHYLSRMLPIARWRPIKNALGFRQGHLILPKIHFIKAKFHLLPIFLVLQK